MDPTTGDVLQQYAAALAEDLQGAATDFYTDDVILRVPGRHPFAGEFRGRDAVRQALEGVVQATDGTFGAREVKGAAFTAESAMVHVMMSAARGGRTAEWERVILYRLSGRRIEAITFFDFDVRALEDLFD